MRRLISLIGPPGSGKTTQIRLLQAAFGDSLLVASVPRLVRRQPDLLALLTTGERAMLETALDAAAAARIRGELAPIVLDEILFRAISQSGPDLLGALDGCPRGEAQARLFLETGRLHDETSIVELYFPAEAGAASLARQVQRESAKLGALGAALRLPVYRRKAAVFADDTVRGLDLLLRVGLRHYRIDATLDPHEIHARVLAALNDAAVEVQPTLVGAGEDTR